MSFKLYFKLKANLTALILPVKFYFIQECWDQDRACSLEWSCIGWACQTHFSFEKYLIKTSLTGECSSQTGLDGTWY